MEGMSSRAPLAVSLMQNYSYSDANATNKKARLGGSRAVTLSRCDNQGGVVAQVDRKITNRCKCVKEKRPTVTSGSLVFLADRSTFSQ
jgi:hypothetical protein